MLEAKRLHNVRKCEEEMKGFFRIPTGLDRINNGTDGLAWI
jgi:hypothetical protein